MCSFLSYDGDREKGVAMRWQRVRAVELYRECTADEAVRVYAVVYNTGGMLVVEELAGELAAWCFGYTPHYRVLPLSPGDASLLGACLGVKGTRQLASVLAIQAVDGDCFDQIAQLAQEAGANMSFDMYRGVRTSWAAAGLRRDRREAISPPQKIF